MANVTGGSLGPIYERLNSAPEYHPLDADTFADWSMEAGDMVTVTRDGNSYQSPVHQSSMTWKKGQQITLSSTGNQERDGIARMSQKKYTKTGSGLRSTNYLHWKVEDQYKQMATGLELTSSSAHLYAYNKYTEMATGLKLTASTAVLYATSKYNQMSTGLKLTASSAVLYATSKYNQMTSGLKLTASSAILYATSKYNQMSSGLELTASSAVLYVNSKYNQMSSGLELTASSAVLYVNSKYNQMKSGLELTSSSATLYAQSRTNRAFIMARINANGEGETLIQADKVSIRGSTTLYGSLDIMTGGLATTGNIQAGLTGGNYIRGQTLKLIGASSSQGVQEETLSANDIAGMIVKAEKDGNTLKLWKHGDAAATPSITFSKATSITQSWDSGNSRVKATASGASDVYYHVTHAFAVHSGTYYVELVHTNSQGTTSTLSGTGKQIQLGRSGNTIQIQNGSGVQYAQTPTYSISGPSLKDETFTENGTYYVPSGYDGYGTINVDVSSTSYYGRTFQCTGREQTYPGSSTYYYTFRLEGNYSFQPGTNYTMYRTSW